MHFVMYAFSNHAVVLHNVTPIDLPAQSVVLSDGVAFLRVCTSIVPGHSSPVEGWQARASCNVCV